MRRLVKRQQFGGITSYFNNQELQPLTIGSKYMPIQLDEVTVTPQLSIMDAIAGTPYSNSYNSKAGYRPDCSGTYCYIVDSIYPNAHLGQMSTLALYKDDRFDTIYTSPKDLQLQKGDAVLLTPQQGKTINITNGGKRTHGIPSHVLYAEGTKPVDINGIVFYPMYETTGNNVARYVYATFDSRAHNLDKAKLKAQLGRDVSIYAPGGGRNELLAVRRLKQQYR